MKIKRQENIRNKCDWRGCKVKPKKLIIWASWQTRQGVQLTPETEACGKHARMFIALAKRRGEKPQEVRKL